MSSFASTTQTSSQFKSFISESQLEDRKRKRQEEWEKVRNADQPLEAPEEDYDPRSLYDRLQEQKDKKQAEFEEAHRLRNMIKGLDNDEIQFLDLVDKTKEEMEAKRLKEEGKEIEEYRKAVASMAAEAEDQKLLELKTSAHFHASGGPMSLTTSQPQKRSQQALLAGVVIKRKSTDKGEEPEKKIKLDDDTGSEAGKHSVDDGVSNEDGRQGNCDESATPLSPTTETTYSSGVTCLGVLPGLGVYSDSSDSDSSTDSDVDSAPRYDLLGRPRWVAHGHSEQPQQSSSRA